jgi:hypothetical protein
MGKSRSQIPIPSGPLLAVALLPGALGACVSSTPAGPDSTAGYELVLQRPLQIPAASAHLRFQDGGPVGASDRFRPHCEFELSTRSEQAQPVDPDRFQVTSIQRRTLSDELSGMPAIPLARCSQDVYYETRLWLASERQPQVRVLICREVFDGCAFGRYPGPAEIGQALGPYFELTPIAVAP